MRARAAEPQSRGLVRGAAADIPWRQYGADDFPGVSQIFPDPAVGAHAPRIFPGATGSARVSPGAASTYGRRSRQTAPLPPRRPSTRRGGQGCGLHVDKMCKPWALGKRWTCAAFPCRVSTAVSTGLLRRCRAFAPLFHGVHAPTATTPVILYIPITPRRWTAPVENLY